MTSAEVIAELSKRGVVLTARGDRLHYEPRRAVDDQLLAEMRRHKQDLMKWALFPEWFQERWSGAIIVSAMVN